MINEEKKRVFEYLGWKICLEEKDRLVKYCSYVDTCYSCPIYHPLDGNDLILAINKMVENKPDMDKYELSDEIDYRSDAHKFLDYSFKCFVQDTGGGTQYDMTIWLFGNPPRFFQLLAEYLGGK